MRAVVAVYAEFQLSAEGFVELLVFLSLVLQQALQLAFNFALECFSRSASIDGHAAASLWKC